MKAKLFLAALAFISAGAMAQEPEQNREHAREEVREQNRTEERTQARENIENPEAREALQNAEQKRNQGVDKGMTKKEEALQNRKRGAEKSEAARSRTKKMRQEKQRVENRSGARPDGAGKATGEAQKNQQQNNTRRAK